MQNMSASRAGVFPASYLETRQIRRRGVTGGYGVASRCLKRRVIE